MPDYETILYERKGHIAYITLNRPEVLNARNNTMRDELNDAWAYFDADEEAFVGILSGAGRAFCSGADIRRNQAPAEQPPRRFLKPAAQGVIGAGGVPVEAANWKPVIAAIHGYAYGGGYLLAATADLIVAAEGTKLQITEIRRGIPSGDFWVTAWFYSGSKFANEIALTGRVFTAEEALQQGLINRVVPADQLMAAAEALAGEVLKNPPLAVRATVRSIRRLPQTLARDAALYQENLHLNQTEDAREAARALAEKRDPEFHAR